MTRKIYSADILENYILMFIEDGISFPTLVEKYGLSMHNTIFYQYVNKYREYGLAALQSRKYNNSYFEELKLKVVEAYLNYNFSAWGDKMTVIPPFLKLDCLWKHIHDVFLLCRNMSTHFFSLSLSSCHEYRSPSISRCSIAWQLEQTGIIQIIVSPPNMITTFLSTQLNLQYLFRQYNYE